jgi:Zn-dependent protease
MESQTVSDRWALRVGSVSVRVGPSWLLLAGWLTFVYAGVFGRWQPELGAARFGIALLFPLLLGASVLLHELGHAAAGAACGLRVRSIELGGLGGQTQFWQSSRKPGHAFLIAGAGPAVSASSGAASGLAAAMIGSGGIGHFLLSQVAIANVLLAIFNLLPGLPLDGGWMLRALVWGASRDEAVAGVVAAWAGIGIAGALVVVPLSWLVLAGYSPGLFILALLVLIAGPVGLGAWSSLGEAKQDRRIARVTAGMLARSTVTVYPGLSASEAWRTLTARGAHSAVVVDAYGGAVALVSGEHLERAVAGGWDGVAVWQLASPLRPEQILSADTPGPEILDRIRDRGDIEQFVLLDAPAGFMVLLASDIRQAATGALPAPGIPFAAHSVESR